MSRTMLKEEVLQVQFVLQDVEEDEHYLEIVCFLPFG